jgi:hypothetical protein
VGKAEAGIPSSPKGWTQSILLLQIADLRRIKSFTFSVRCGLMFSSMKNSVKRIVSALVLGIGLTYSLIGCAVFPRAVFVIGANDSAASIVALLTCFPGFFFASVLAFWKRRIAGVVMMILPVIWLWGLLDERSYMLNVRHFPQEGFFIYLWEILQPCLPVLALGAFALFTGIAGWPEVVGKGSQSSEEC